MSGPVIAHRPATSLSASLWLLVAGQLFFLAVEPMELRTVTDCDTELEMIARWVSEGDANFADLERRLNRVLDARALLAAGVPADPHPQLAKDLDRR